MNYGYPPQPLADADHRAVCNNTLKDRPVLRALRAYQRVVNYKTYWGCARPDRPAPSMQDLALSAHARALVNALGTPSHAEGGADRTPCGSTGERKGSSSLDYNLPSCCKRNTLALH